MLNVTDLQAGYGGAVVLHGVSLEVKDGEAVIILGPNGHGKTTLLRAISGLVRPTAGTVEFDGQVISQLNPADICLVQDVWRAHLERHRILQFPYVYLRDVVEEVEIRSGDSIVFHELLYLVLCKMFPAFRQCNFDHIGHRIQSPRRDSNEGQLPFFISSSPNSLPRSRALVLSSCVISGTRSSNPILMGS